ncbi:sulfatase-like hydrolase/transferase [Candidatus Nitrotoga sp. 1052]|uniref:sulfatase-like hydrolase/transferase n=1 Tax=Candidatus Nitrotoga sp. 1052 TaxID=2886964 RepID=UPI001EF3E694|nr:sulfatase-like hydrolase/transferase [Candidatus Nitrotoga sp. 1052]CAH1087202.1 membrane hypothetical protein [Candidatus Nitrotoga sp. 1052]
MANLITVLICTHNRADLLERLLASLNAAHRPEMPVRILVAANACTDDTVARMQAYETQQATNGWLPLRLIEVPTPGKSHALNRAIPEIDTELTAFVDDDHRVDENYLVAIAHAAQSWPDAGLYCGRILPDWNGTEPAWVHDEGPYRIYPLPVPRYNQGDQPKTITAEEGPIPGGGNLVVRHHVFALAGQFSTELGPHGHDLGGGEDSEYVLRAMIRGIRCQYAPDIVQHHYVDIDRLKLSYLLKKSFQRTRSTSRIQGHGRIPLYMWRKLAEYGLHSVFSRSWAKRRFYWMRTAAALGELQGRRESGHRGKDLSLPPDRGNLLIVALAISTVTCGLIAWFTSGSARWAGGLPALFVAGVGSMALLTKSLMDFSQTGPRIQKEVLAHYRRYTLFALARLSAWAFSIMLFTGSAGVLLYYMLNVSLSGEWSSGLATLAAVLGISGAVMLQFIRKLRFNPGLLVASMHYRISRFYGLWRWMTPERIYLMQFACISATLLLLIATSLQLIKQNQMADLIALWAAVLFFAGTITWAAWLPEARPPRRTPERAADAPPNILMIGSDTLRADRLGTLGYRRALTPNIDKLAELGVLFSNCYVPCARTAPSLISLMTGTWPHTHGIRDNFNADDVTRLKVDALPHLLKAQGYRTAAISDWCGGDMGKFSFGFDYTDLPEDQWNLKYLIRQGPKDLRLFLSLFTHNRLGRLMLPEIYYLGGVPLTQPMGKYARHLVSRLSESTQPFFLNVFYSTTHPPFASEWPWYTRFADPSYNGESKFAMAKLTDPFDIIRRQGAPKEEFDLDQIIDLYDSCVAQFDDEVGRMLQHLDTCGLAGNTIVVVYSDHGMEFFEHNTWGQGNSAVGDFSPRIPLLISDPRKPASRKVDQVVRSIDLAPTLLELAGANPAANMDGVSLAACFSQHEHCPQLDAFNETGMWITDIPGLPDKHLRYPDLLELIAVPDRESGTLTLKPEYLPIVLTAKDRMLRSGRWKLVYQPLEEGYQLMLFDVESDPGCTRDVIDCQPEVAQSLWQRLELYIQPEERIANHHAVTCGEGAIVKLPALTSTHLRRKILANVRAAFDWCFERFAHRTRVLFVLTDSYGFACQSPVIRALQACPDVLVLITTDKPDVVNDIDFATPEDRVLFHSLQLPSRRARLSKWHMLVSTHMNPFYPAFNALRLYMHHGPGFGILGNKTGPIKQCDIFCGLSEAEYDWFDRYQPGLFNERRVFIPVGFPKSDALCRGEFDRRAVLEQLGLPDRMTLLITSHWQPQAILRSYNAAPLRALAQAFPECNLIQTGHPWLWKANHNVPADWQAAVLEDMRIIEAQYPHVRFIQTSDVETLLAAADLLVGDYSSVMSTYSLLDRPIVFFDQPDFEFTFAGLKDIFVGASHSFSRLDELVPACQAALSNPQAKAEGRAHMRRTFYAHEGHSAEYMAGLIQKIGRVSTTDSAGWQRVQASAIGQ